MTEIIDQPIVPDFGDKTSKPDAAASAPSASARPKPAPVAAEAGPRKICFVASKGNLDTAYPALIMANAALGEGVETHIFFTFWGFDLITERTMDHLKFSMLGNTAMHIPQAPKVPIPQILGAIPGVTAGTTLYMRKSFERLEIPDVREFLDIIVAAGGHLWGCKLSADMNGLTEDDLYSGVEGIISATDFIELSEGAQIIFT